MERADLRGSDARQKRRGDDRTVGNQVLANLSRAKAPRGDVFIPRFNSAKPGPAYPPTRQYDWLRPSTLAGEGWSRGYAQILMG